VTIALVLGLVWFLGVPLGTLVLASICGRRAQDTTESPVNGMGTSPELLLAPPREFARACESRGRSRAQAVLLAARRSRRAL
jgi:hypothetical protein